MSYARRMEREAERLEADAWEREAREINAAVAARCPIATALAAELKEANQAEYDAQRFGDRWALISAAERACFEAQQGGRDLRLLVGPQDAWDVAQIARFAREES